METLYGREPEEHRRYFSRLGWALFALLLVPLAVQAIPAVILSLRGTRLLTDPWFNRALSSVALFLVGYPLAWFLLRGVPGSARTGEGPLPLGRLLRVFFVALAALYLANYLTTLLTDLIGNLRGIPVTNPMGSLKGNPLAYNIVVFCILSPIVEELFFRGLLLDRLRPYGERFAALATAAAFAMMHGNLSQMLYAFAVGILFGYLVLRTGRLWQAMLLHAAVNFVGSCMVPLLEALIPVGVAREEAMAAVSLLMLFSIVMGVIFFLRYRRTIWLELGETDLSEGQKWGFWFGNPGMIFYTAAVLVLVCIFLFAR